MEKGGGREGMVRRKGNNKDKRNKQFYSILPI
jgi:hypothetical protein